MCARSFIVHSLDDLSIWFWRWHTFCAWRCMPKAKCIIVGNECGWMKLCHTQLLRLLVEKKPWAWLGGLLYIDSYLGHLHLQPLKFGASTSVYHMQNWVLNIFSIPTSKHENFYKLLPTTNFVFKKWDLLWRE
jgi:hypothetical protein